MLRQSKKRNLCPTSSLTAAFLTKNHAPARPSTNNLSYLCLSESIAGGITMVNKIIRHPAMLQKALRVLHQIPMVKEKSEGDHLPLLELPPVYRILDKSAGLTSFEGFLALVKLQMGIQTQNIDGLCEGLDVIERSINLN
jgi:hypothetical protein